MKTRKMNQAGVALVLVLVDRWVSKTRIQPNVQPSRNTRALNVTQRAAGANMSVDVNIDSSNFGGGLFMTTAGVPYFGYTNAAINATVATADPTNPRRDIVVAYIDLSLITTGTTNNLGAFKVKVVTGTAAASPTDPNAAAIQASVGAGNPYIQLARVSLTAALGSITNAVITDLRTPAANAMPYLYGGSSNTVGHLVPNLADDTITLLAAVQTLTNKLLSTGTTFANNIIPAAALAANAITLGYAQITSGFATSATSATQLTGLSAAVTVPAGGRRVKITLAGNLLISKLANGYVEIWDGTVGSGTRLQQLSFTAGGPSYLGSGSCFAVVTPAAGAKTYNAAVYTNDGTATVNVQASATSPAFLLVEAI